jgi:hypothetical protein
MMDSNKKPSSEELARLALAHIQQPYPYAISQLLTESEGGTRLEPAERHPIFGTCYDWHSSVHMHWSLVRLLNLGLEESLASEIVRVFDARLTTAKAARELEHASAPAQRHWERPYGWAWLLKLYAELAVCVHPHAGRWREALLPLADYFADALWDYFVRLPGPVRHGVHTNTAFALIHARNYALTVGDHEFTELIAARAQAFYASDRAYAWAYDRSAEDFLSPGLTEALLLSLTLPREAFLAWLEAFGPIDLAALAPITVSAENRTDARIAHLDGLNLSRAWCLRGLMQQLTPGEDPRWRQFGELAGALCQAAAPAVLHGDYVATHWLASFWLLAETEWFA